MNVPNIRDRERRETLKLQYIVPGSYPVAVMTVPNRKRSRLSGVRGEL